MKTVVVGASENTQRYANMATRMLQEYDHEVVPVGLKEGHINGTDIVTSDVKPDNVHTVSLYVGPRNQPHWQEYILGLKPERIIFNPGTENPEMEEAARQAGIETVHGCTLVMLRSKTF